MAKGMSKAAKAEAFDTIKAQGDKTALILHDMVNGKLSFPVRLFFKDFETGAKGTIKVQASWRMMPLYLVLEDSSTTKWPHVYTEQEIEELDSSYSVWNRKLKSAMGELRMKREKAA